MQKLFDEEARKNSVYPIMVSGSVYRAMKLVSSAGGFKQHYEFWGRDIRLPAMSSPPIFSLPFSIEAEIDILAQGADGAGRMIISANDKEVASGELPRCAHIMAGTGETFAIGRDSNASVSDEYRKEEIFTGEINHVRVDLKIPLSMMLKGIVNKVMGN